MALLLYVILLTKHGYEKCLIAAKKVTNILPEQKFLDLNRPFSWFLRQLKTEKLVPKI